MKRTPGSICNPSSGTVSVANGTTKPMVKSLCISFSLLSVSHSVFRRSGLPVRRRKHVNSISQSAFSDSEGTETARRDAPSILGRAGCLDDRRPFANLPAQIHGEFLRRARYRLHSELEEMLPGRRLGQEIR